MTDLLIVLALGFVMGMRHATDADHVVAVTTIVSRQRVRGGAAAVGLLWGIGHTLTLLAVGGAIILLNLTIPHRLGLGMEISVGAMLVVLGALNVAAFRKQPGDHVSFEAIDRWGEGSRRYRLARPVVVGVVHGLAGSAAVTLLVVAAVGEPRWAIAYLLVFGLGTMAGMVLITVGVASLFRTLAGRSVVSGRRLRLACGVASIVFGLSFAYQAWAAGVAR